MKIDRRSFLSLGFGATAGVTLSPLPWKLIDDIAIWTQNWPWTPVPERGEASFINSTCTLCPGGCGITVRKIADRSVKIEGMKSHPVNDGGICLLGLSGLQLLYGYDRRVKGPLKRTGKRGEGKWEKITWEEAVSEVAKRLGELRSKGESHTVSAISGSARGTVPQLLERFLTVYGSPNFFCMPSIQDSYDLTVYLTQGTRDSVGFDVENADFVLSFGSGILEGWGSPVHMFQANSRWREGKGKVVQIEPRLSITAAKADKWIPINPGTDTVLALGLAHVIIRESLYNKEFVNNHTFGFDDWTDDQGVTHKGFKKFVLEEYGPDHVVKLTGLDKSTIISLARKFAGASKPLAICGRGQGRSIPGSLSEFMAVHALNALTGNINRQGGVWALPEVGYVSWPEAEMDAAAANGMQKNRIDGAGSEKYPYSRFLLNRVPDAINSGKEYPIQALFVTDANPLYSLPGSNAVKEAFDKIPFVVSFSSYMDETAKNADLILPNHVYLERYEDVPLPVGLVKPIIGLVRPVIKPRFETKHLGDVILLMAKALGGSVAKSFPWNSYESCLKETMGDKWAGLVEKGFWTDPNFKAPGWENAFETPSKKFEFVSANFGGSEASDIDKLYGFNPGALEGDAASFPLVLMPYDSMRLAAGFIGDPPFTMKAVEDTVLKNKDILVEVNPETAKSLGISHGRYANLTTPVGTAKVKVHLFDGIMPGLVAIPRGLGHTAYDGYLADKGLNFNEFIGSVEDPVSGFNAAWGIRAKLTIA